jgi:aminoglycoside phosphotransferase (APT) family kinase protein
MLLTARSVPNYLLERRLLSLDAIVHDEVAVVDASRRNRNFKVTRAGAPGFFLKQIASPEPTAVETLQREAECYRSAHYVPAFAPLAEVLPKVHGYDAARHVLVLELIAGGEDVAQRHRRLGAFPPAVGAAMGRALARVHGPLAPVVTADEHRDRFPRRVPWILEASRPESVPVAAHAGGNRQLLGIVQTYAELQAPLDALRGEWRHETLVHGDIKWENCIVVDGEDGAPPRVSIVDWEIADVGDPAWDVGSIFQAYLTYWVVTMPAAPGARPADLVAGAPHPIQTMQPAMRAFWHAYAGAAPDGAADALLERAIRYAAARMVQSAYETLPQAELITANAVLLLQLSSNILERPRVAVSDLLGL